ncbi:hypothetical protein QJS04_geneDACA004692 [Acorus gramineus]|uniref:Protein transport protein SEC23 n=1 Tax=Acorus gramineus TaxID=55184 RepID=A0AAV9BY78_ACOGR|nr:hypothetical protein QJS04_geneDACA004692 [Acorus gramineus]
MATSQPPPLNPNYSTVTASPPVTPTPRPEKRLAPPVFSPPTAPRRSSLDQLPSTSSRTPLTPSPSPADGVTSGSAVPHFSTPPGPPMFSSPLRPAAVPFRTSPATPQPVSFSSVSSLPTSSPQSGLFIPGSSLPTSSPPQYSNGLVERHSQPLDSLEESNLSEQSPYVFFSAHKILKHKKLGNASSLGFGALVSPGREIAQGPQTVYRSPHRCQNCGAYSNLYCKILLESGQWQCMICKKLNGSEGEYIASSRDVLQHCTELSFSAIDYIQTGNSRPGYIPAPDTRRTSPVFLVIDECLDEAHLQHLQGSLHAFVDSLPPSTRIGIISYGRTVSVYDFSETSTASADVLPGDKSPTQESLKALIYGTGIYLSPIHVCLPVAHTIFSSLRPYKLKLPEASRDRCLGTAVEVALAIIQGPSAEMSRSIIKRSGGNCRILVCAGGPNTYGPGAVPHSFNHPNYPYMEKTAMKWMEHLGHEAHRHDTVVDLLCAGQCPVRVPVLQPLAKASGGVFVLHDDFGEAFGVNLQRASTRAAGSHGLFEVRCSKEVLVTQVIGPGEEAPADAHETFKNDSSTCIQMLSVEESQCFALSMETKGDITSDYVFFQFAIRYSDIFQAEISRVITVRLPTVDSVSAYLASIQEEVAAVLIAKRTLLHGKTSSDAIDMRVTVDERVRDMALKFGSQQPKSKLYRFPKELSSLPENLFHLRRGPLLGSIVGHEDERSVLRNLFLNASFDLSIRMLAPRCLMHREEGTFEELPAYDLSMQSDAAVVLDHGTDVFIWLGAELAAQEGKSAAALAACRTLAEELTEQRFPAPRILAFKEGSSQARYFVSRLIPAHRDPPYEQARGKIPSAAIIVDRTKGKTEEQFHSL